MTGRKRLRAMVLRQRKAKLATGGVVSGPGYAPESPPPFTVPPTLRPPRPRPLLELRYDRPADVAEFAERMRAFAAKPTRNGCTCESAIYSECHCAARGEAGQP